MSNFWYLFGTKIICLLQIKHLFLRTVVVRINISCFCDTLVCCNFIFWIFEMQSEYILVSNFTVFLLPLRRVNESDSEALTICSAKTQH